MGQKPAESPLPAESKPSQTVSPVQKKLEKTEKEGQKYYDGMSAPIMPKESYADEQLAHPIFYSSSYSSHWIIELYRDLNDMMKSRQG
jgi:hypothetical protein